MKIENIYFKDYFNLHGEEKELYEYIISNDKQFLQPVDVFGIGKLREFNFQLIKDFQFDYNNGLSWVQLIDYMCKFSGKSKEKILTTRLLPACQFKRFLIAEIKLINQVEEIELSHEADDLEEAAGIERFAMFGYYSQFRELAGHDITKIDAIGKRKYSDCFVELSYRKRLDDFEKKVAELRNQRAKQHGSI